MKRFNSKGSVLWRHRPKRNKGGYTVGGLVESRSLRNSIVYETESYNRARGRVKVFTDPSAFGGTYSHRGFCFAAVHNSDDPSVRTGRVANMSQRQFMPTEKNDSSVMNDKLRELNKYPPQIDRQTLENSRYSSQIDAEVVAIEQSTVAASMVFLY